MIHTMIVVIIILAAFALFWWGVNALAFPQPIKVVLLVIIGLLALLFLYNHIGDINTGTFHLR